MAQASSSSPARHFIPTTSAVPVSVPESVPISLQDLVVAGTRRRGIRLDSLVRPDGTTRLVLHPATIDDLDAGLVRTAVSVTRAAGYLDAISTPALAAREADAFLQAGFEPAAELLLMRAVLGHQRAHGHPREPGSASCRLVERPRNRRRAGAWIDAGLRVDAAAFPDGQQFDALSVREALRATPKTQVTFALDGDVMHPDRVIGWAISGRAGRRAYLQRLAVHPSAAGNGVGAALVDDALLWATWGRAEVMAVNTMLGNARAVALYERHGFEALPERLTVLRLPAVALGVDSPLEVAR